jgi:hypothetical protein
VSTLAANREANKKAPLNFLYIGPTLAIYMSIQTRHLPIQTVRLFWWRRKSMFEHNRNEASDFRYCLFPCRARSKSDWLGRGRFERCCKEDHGRYVRIKHCL